MQHEDLLAKSALAVSFFDASEDCVKVIGLNGELLAMNANGICLLEIDDFESLRGGDWADMWPAEIRGIVTDAVARAGRGEGVRFAADCPTAKGTPKSWEVVVWPVFGDGGEPAQLMSISRDVTETKRLEEQRALFTRELSHRIKNTFAVVDGLIALSARSAGEARSFASTLRERLAGLGRAISYMAPPEFVGLAREQRSILGLLEALLGPYGAADGPDQQIFIAGDDAPIGPEATTTFALIFNELATNALKYGGLSAPGRRVNVTCVVASGSFRVEWAEPVLPDGQPHASGADGFGTALLEKAIVRQLGGSLSREWTPEGLVICMTAPLDRIAA